MMDMVLFYHRDEAGACKSSVSKSQYMQRNLWELNGVIYKPRILFSISNTVDKPTCATEKLYKNDKFDY